MARGRAHDDQKKAAVMAALLTGQSVGEVAKEFEIPVSTIKKWRSESGQFSQVEPQKKEEIGELLVKYLMQNLETITAQSKFFADTTWLREQTASEVAVLHGVIVDKSIRLLEAIERARGTDGPPAADSGS